MAVYLRLMADLDAGVKRNSEEISEIDLTDPEDARVLMPEQGTDILAHFGENHFLDRYQRYKAHIAEWRQQYPHLKSGELRYDNQVVLRMASGAETANAAGAETAAPAASAKPSARKPGAPAAKSKVNKHTAAKRRLAAAARREAPKRAAARRDKHSSHTAQGVEGE
jgi:cell division protein FtsQ